MAGLFEMGVQKENLFLMGLFSVLDAILDVPLDKALDMVLVPDKVKEALLKRDNDLGEIYNFITLYERGEWTEVSRIALMKNISVKDIYDAYYDSLTWYGRMINLKIDEDEIDASDEGDDDDL